MTRDVLFPFAVPVNAIDVEQSAIPVVLSFKIKLDQWIKPEEKIFDKGNIFVGVPNAIGTAAILKRYVSFGLVDVVLQLAANNLGT